MSKRKSPKTIETHYARRSVAQEHPHGGAPVGDGEGRSEPYPGGIPTPQPRPRSAARVARQGRAGLVRPRGAGAAAVHPGEGAPEGIDRRPAAAQQGGEQAADDQLDLFADFNGLPDDNARTEFYRHDANWSNRMILGDSLQVMASLAEREGLRGKVQCIYLAPPPYGIKFNSNFQWSTTSRDVRDGKAEHITREPEQVKAVRDTWRDGIHSYLTYLRDRLIVARDLLSDSGTIFVQIGNENVHRIRTLMDEIFGKENYVGTVVFQKTGSIDQFLIRSRGCHHPRVTGGGNGTMEQLGQVISLC